MRTGMRRLPAILLVVLAGLILHRAFALEARTGPAQLPPQVASLIGTWEGVWEQELPSRLVVTRVSLHGPTPLIVYRWIDYPRRAFAERPVSVRATLLPSGGVQWTHVGGYSLELSPDGRTLTGTRNAGRVVARVVMRRVAS